MPGLPFATMRIHLELDPARVVKKTPAGGAAAPNFLPAHPAGPLLKLGLTPDGHEDVVLIELQGELTYEGESSGRTIGLLGFERPVSENLDAPQARELTIWAGPPDASSRPSSPAARQDGRPASAVCGHPSSDSL